MIKINRELRYELNQAVENLQSKWLAVAEYSLPKGTHLVYQGQKCEVMAHSLSVIPRATQELAACCSVMLRIIGNNTVMWVKLDSIERGV